MFFPFRDHLPTARPPIVTVAIIAANVLVFLYQISLGERGQQALALGFGMIPAVLFGTRELDPAISAADPWVTIFTSMFLHGGILHIAGNMLYLWVFGNNVEDAMGHARFVLFYLLCGVAAAMTQAVIDPDGAIPMIGASGAISGVLGAYLLMHPQERVDVLFVYGLATVIALPAVAVLGWWIVVQIVNAVLAAEGEGGVAWYAHIGGFVAGLILIGLFRRPPRPPAFTSSRWGSWNRRGPWG